MDEDGGERQRLAAALARTAPDAAFEAIEEPVEILCRPRAVGIEGQPVHALVGRPQRARGIPALEVVPKGLIVPPRRTGTDERRQLLFAVMLALGHRWPRFARQISGSR